ncbi:MAG: hypothetical protein AAFN77_16715 [Planctomycetota bacterium]
MLPIINHLVFLAISVTFTVVVGHYLFTNGKYFLKECFPKGNTADAVNRLFLAGFYLMNIAFIFLSIRYGENAETPIQLIKVVSYRVGIVALVMGLMHLNNLFWCNLLKSRITQWTS